MPGVPTVEFLLFYMLLKLVATCSSYLRSQEYFLIKIFFPHLFIHLIISFFQYEVMNIYLIFELKCSTLSNILLLKLTQVCYFSWLLLSCNLFPSLRETLGYAKYSSLIFRISRPFSKVDYLSNELWFFLRECWEPVYLDVG